MFFGNPSLATRTAIGKLVGLAIGILGALALPFFWAEAPGEFRLGVLLWYATVGAVIGVYGVFTHHPVLKLPLPWWVRAPLIGAWMNLVVTLLAIGEMRSFMAASFGPDGIISSPYWFVAEGALVGLLIGYLCTRFGGEGRAAVEGMDRREDGPAQKAEGKAEG